MDFDTFGKGIAILSACIADFKVEEEKSAVWFEFLKDLRDEDYLAGIRILCREMKNVYPNTNIVAIIREASDRARNKRLDAIPTRLRLEEGYSDKQFREGKEKLNQIIVELKRRKGI